MSRWGPTRHDVLRLVPGQAMLQSLAGTAVGIGGAVLVSGLMAKMLDGVHPTDPVTSAGVTTLPGLAAPIATVVPARRAARIEPVTALLSE